jgi:hypothetical protein
MGTIFPTLIMVAISTVKCEYSKLLYITRNLQLDYIKNFNYNVNEEEK